MVLRTERVSSGDLDGDEGSEFDEDRCFRHRFGRTWSKSAPCRSKCGRCRQPRLVVSGGKQLSVGRRWWGSPIAGPKSHPPECCLEKSAQGSDVDGPRFWPQSRCWSSRRDSPDRVGSAKVGFATKAGGERREMSSTTGP